MIILEVKESAGEKLRLSIQRNILGEIRSALPTLQIDWAIELFSQKISNQLVWKELSPAYLSRKESEAARGKDGVKYTSVLSRTGYMFENYLNGMQVNDSAYSVSIPYPTNPGKQQGLPARYFQEAEEGRAVQPFKRAFDTVKFEDIAFNVFYKAVDKGING